MAGQDLYEGFHPDSFQKDQIMRRLRSKAIELWGLQEADIDNLDPVVDLLLGACAVEFERTAHEINTSQARVLERLAQLMVPEVFTNARPAHAVMHAKAETPVTVLKVEDQFSVEKEILQNNKNTKVSIVFSPATDCKVFDASVACQADGSKIVFYENPGGKAESIHAAGKQTLPPNQMWVGIRLNKRINNLKGMSFFFDWKNEPQKVKYLSLLSLSQWSAGEEAWKMVAGLETKNKAGFTEFDAITELENHVLQVYQHHFLTIAGDTSSPKCSMYPPEFEKVFSGDGLKKLKEELLWVRVRLPEGISLQAVTEMYCMNNCLPVLNRQMHLNNRPYALSAKLNIIPLQTEDHFLSIRRVHSDMREYRSVSLQKVREVEDGSYSVRQGGVARFDQRNAVTMLNYLYEMMRDESAAFSAFGNYALNAEIKNLDQNLTRLQMHFLQKVSEQSLRTHLLLHTKAPEDVWIEFWSTQGKLANHIPSGKRLTLISQANVKRESLMLMNASSGGREPMNESEKLHAYKYSLLTRSRIVTEEDIKAACFAELGDKIEGVEIRKGCKKDLTSLKGFVRTLDVVLTPARDFDEIDWHAACNELQAFLERKKMFLTSIQVYIQSTTEADVWDRR
jgi:hypothetical protein